MLRIEPANPTYPAGLRTGTAAPELTVWGRMPAAGARVVAIVGARAASQAVMDWTHAVALRLAADGLVVLSGGALGVDGAAHRGALAADGCTVAVLGSGINQLYPDRHRALFAEIAQRGAVVSPFAADDAPIAGRFLRRNQYIAAWAEAVVVAEASLRSGSLSTARAARKLGRKVFAKPGSPGCDALICDGATPVTNELDVVRGLAGDTVALALESPTARQQQILTSLGTDILDGEQIAQRVGLGARQVMADVQALVSMAHLYQAGGFRFARTPASFAAK